MVHLTKEKILKKEELKMANVKTDRKPLFGNSRSHALNATRKKQGLNTQKVTVNGKTIVTTAREAKKIRKESK
jgi:ribosomal protein L28